MYWLQKKKKEEAKDTVKMMEKISLFSALLAPYLVTEWKKKIYFGNQANLPVLTRSNKLSFKCYINTSIFIFCGFWGDWQLRGPQLLTALWNRNYFPHYIFCHCHGDYYHTHSDMTRIPVCLSAALFPNNCICLCLHLPYRLSHSTR